jgi:hypothetical protein
MAISFMMLVVTGFTLRFARMWRFHSLVDLQPRLFDAYILLYQIAGAAMLTTSLCLALCISFTILKPSSAAYK